MKERIKKIFLAIKMISTAFIDDGCFNRAGSLAYTTLFALVPLLTIVLVIAFKFPSMQALEMRIENFAFNNLIPSSNHVIQTYTHDFVENASNLSWIGLATLIITVVSLMMSIEGIFNEILQLDKKKTSYLRSIIRHGAFIILFPLLLGGALLITSYIYSIALIQNAVVYVNSFHTLLGFLPDFFVFVLIFFLYKFMPAARTSIKAVMIGALFTTIIFLLTKELFQWYIHFFSGYKILYGAFAAMPIFLLWLYISWLLILLGFQVTRYIQLKK